MKEMHPYDLAIWLYHDGCVYLDEKRYPVALEAFLKSIALDEHFKTHHRIAQVLLALGRVAEAEAHLERGYECNSNNDRMTTDLAELLLRRGETERARRLLEEVLARNTTYGPAKRQLDTMDKE